MDSVGVTSVLYHMVLVVIGSFVLLNLFVAVLTDGFNADMHKDAEADAISVSILLLYRWAQPASCTCMHMLPMRVTPLASLSCLCQSDH